MPNRAAFWLPRFYPPCLMLMIMPQTPASTPSPDESPNQLPDAPPNAQAADAAPVVVARLVAAQISIHACMTGMRMAAPLWALRHGYSAAAVGMLLALFALTQVFLSLPAGRYADRHGLRRPVRLAVCTATLGAAIATIAPTYAGLCLSALLCGGATGTALIALQRHVGLVARDAVQRRRMFSWLAIGPAFSNLLGPVLAGLAIDGGGHAAALATGAVTDAAADAVTSSAGFRLAFALLMLLPLGAWFWVRGVAELPRPEAREGQSSETAWGLLQRRSLRRLLLMNLALSMCWDVHTFAVPILGHERGLSASIIGGVLGSFALSAATVRVLMPLLGGDRIRETWLLLGAMLVTALLFALYPLMPGAMEMALCSALLGLTLGSVQPMILSLLHHTTPAHSQGRAIGLRMMTINASSVCMPLMFGSLGSVMGVSALFWAVATVVGSAARLPWLLHTQDIPYERGG